MCKCYISVLSAALKYYTHIANFSNGALNWSNVYTSQDRLTLDNTPGQSLSSEPSRHSRTPLHISVRKIHSPVSHCHSILPQPVKHCFLLINFDFSLREIQ